MASRLKYAALQSSSFVPKFSIAASGIKNSKVACTKHKAEQIPKTIFKVDGILILA